MPIISAVGKRRPQSTMTIRPSYSTTVMFLPISPTPPSGRTRRLPALMWPLLECPVCGAGPPANAGRAHSRGGDPFQQPVPREHVVDRGAFLLVALDQRQAQRAAVVALHLQGRLDRRGARGDEHRRVALLQLLVELGARVGFVVDAAHLVAGHVAGHADAARAAY